MKSSLRAQLALGVSAVLVAAGLTVVGGLPVGASQPSDPGPANHLPSSVPSAITPAVNNGKVYGIAQTGNTMVIGGSFTSVGGQVRNHLAAFNKTTGALSSIAPNFNNDVNSVIPGPTANTVIVGGAFTTLNGVATQFLAEIDLTTGNPVSTFKPPAFDFGYVNDLVARGNRLYVAGTFSKAGNKLHAGLISVNFTTGALDPFVNIQFSGHHNDSGSGAQGWLGPWNIDVTRDGNTMAVIGNFKFADGLLRDQVALIDLTGASAQVAPWATDRYSPLCFNFAFDSYVRGVSFSPDGSYFIVNATGGGVAGTLCDATTRFDTNINDSAAQPRWVDETGGDTTWGVTVTDSVVYVGGHNRWNNNPLGSDHALPGAVPRPGLAAFDPDTGRPFKWNPGRKPLGTAVYAMLATAEGLWIGSNSDWIGNFQYQRPKLAFFPYAGGYTPAPTNIAGLPGTAYVAGSFSSTGSNVLYRVDAGGPAIQSIDSGPNWAGDDSDPSPYRGNGSNPSLWSPGASMSATVPASTPNAIFDSERWSPNDTSGVMRWTFPVPSGTHIQVRLFFANRCTCTSASGQRRFTVRLDNSTVLNRYDIVADVGDQVGTMKAFNITSDGTVNIDFSHYVENPLVNGIEIINNDAPPPPPGANDTLSKINFDGTSASQATASNQSIDFGNWRGAFLVGNTVYYGYTDSNMYSRSFDNGTFGPAVKIDPYNDPFWSPIDTDDGTTFRGAVPSLYGQFPNVTGMTYYQGRLYYTLFNDSHLYSRWFLPDSGITDETKRTETSSISFTDADGMFVAGGKLYYVTKADGVLHSVDFNNGTVTGSATSVSGPGVDGTNWRNRALFLASSAPPNQPPTAAFAPTCSNLSCTFNADGSSDSDGSVVSYDWNFGDGHTGTGVNPAHDYDDPGTYTVSLTVTDDDGAQSAAVSHPVTVSRATASGVSFVAAAHSAGGNTKVQTVTVPGSAAAGNTALVFFTQPSAATWTGPTGVTGWTKLDTYTNGTLVTSVWSKSLTGADVGATVRFDSAAFAHGSAELSVYAGADSATPVSQFAHSSDAAASSSHISPNATAAAGNYVVSFWADRSSTVRTWTAPVGLTARDASADAGAGVTVQGLVADTGNGASAGTVGGLTATTDANTDRGSAWTIVLQAAATPPPSGVNFVGANHSAGGNTKVQTADVPAGSAAGNTALLFLTKPSAATWTGPTGVTGWTQLDAYTNGTLVTTVWSKTLAAGDVGATVRFDSAAFGHGSVELAVYSGVSAATPVASFAHSSDAAAAANHVSPAATAAAGDYVVSFWADRSSVVRTWTPPGALTARDASPDSGAGVTVQGLVADSGSAATGGSVGGMTATTDANTDRGSAWTIVLDAA